MVFRYLPSFPYQDNSILHLYAGLICFHLANQLDSEGSKESLLSQAKGHIDRSLALNSSDITAKAFLEEVRKLQTKHTTFIHFPADNDFTGPRAESFNGKCTRAGERRRRLEYGHQHRWVTRKTEEACEYINLNLFIHRNRNLKPLITAG